MIHSAKIIADSVSPDGERLTTLEVVFPRSILAEANTHRMLSRNSASSRAVPIEKMIRMMQEHPYVPTHWGKNQKGMQADEELQDIEKKAARAAWYGALYQAIGHAKELMEIGVHKQVTNRLLEPFMWHTVIVSATEWDNWDHLRMHRDASPEIKRAAELMYEARANSRPVELKSNQWHLPFWGTDADIEEGRSLRDMIKISVARCARVSYLTHHGVRDPQADVDMCDNKLSMHMSPFEHVARPMSQHERGLFRRNELYWHEDEDGLGEWKPTGRVTHFLGNFDGFVQYRKMIPNEHDILGAR